MRSLALLFAPDMFASDLRYRAVELHADAYSHRLHTRTRTGPPTGGRFIENQRVDEVCCAWDGKGRVALCIQLAGIRIGYPWRQGQHTRLYYVNLRRSIRSSVSYLVVSG
jgi:hypothetical protein